MKDKTPKHLVHAHRLICGCAKLLKKNHSKAEFKHLAEVRRIFEDRNIVGLGIAEKVTDKKCTGELSLCFYVEKKISKRRLWNHKIIPPIMSIGGRSVVTDVFEIGVVRAQSNIKTDPIKSGFSVSHERALSAGTVGLIVKRGSKFYILSNAHVLAKSGLASIGDKVIYPGRFDSGHEQPIGELTKFAPLEKTEDPVNRADAALAEIASDFVDNIDFRIEGAKTPLDVIKPMRGMEVVAFGRSSGRTESIIKDIHLSIVIRIPSLGRIGFIDQVCCEPYTDAGDSGSIVVDKALGNIVGLHVAGSEKGSIFTPIENVRQSLEFDFQFVNF